MSKQDVKTRGAHRGRTVILAACLATLLAVPALAQTESVLRWDLTPLFPDKAAWQGAKEELARQKQALAEYEGRLSESGEVLAEALGTMFDLQKDAARLYVYAALTADQDTRVPEPQGMKQQLQSLFAQLQAEAAWVEPEILAIPPEKLGRFVAETPELADYRRFLEQLEKQREHVLSPEVERVLGMAGMITGDGSTIGNLLRNSDIDWPTITLSDGTELRVDVAGYSRGRQSANREDRIKTYEAFYETLDQFSSSLSTTLASTVKEHVFNTRVRNYDSTLEASLSNNEVDPAVYRMLIEEINESLPTLYRYFELRKDILGLDDLRYHDMYVGLVPDIEEDYSWERSKKLVTEALAPLGEQYADRFAKALESGWVDVYPREGKRSGAYVIGAAYDVHPYMMLNHQDDYTSASTLAHEGGHLMHSWYSNEAQPYPTSDYVIFVAEVASTLNEILFFEKMVDEAGSDEERLAILGSFLDNMRQTVFRQTMFAEFELAIHEAGEQGAPLTGETLSNMYGELLRRYHGHDEGVVTIDDLYDIEWAFIPHFHYNYYVYQYATSFVAGVALAEKIGRGDQQARDAYLELLKAGSTKPPVDLLKDAGVDMTTPEPIRAAMRFMNDIMDQIDEIRTKEGAEAAQLSRAE
jgi:oligoendopeptidase F